MVRETVRKWSENHAYFVFEIIRAAASPTAV